MENFGSEIGQKMRSAVKAKLLELGTGGSAGYIDDELPDYVMIMVANKRSKQQMIADLNLFLGSQTELFVTWLHEVLQKLQEVTLPAANAATTKKRKCSQREETVVGKKDKRANRKEKRSGKKPSEEKSPGGAEKPTTTTGAIPAISSITDVFAEDLLEKAKKTLDATTDSLANIKKGKGRSKEGGDAAAAAAEPADEPLQQEQETNEFDIPTISEISSTTGGNGVSGNREKDLAELADIQKKIYAAKKHLKHLGELEEAAESDDEDFLNLKDDGSADEFDEAGDLAKKAPTKAKSPIVFDAHDAARESSVDDEPEIAGLPVKRRHLTPPPLASAAVKSATNERRNENVRERLDEVSSRRSRERERREPPAQAAKKRPVHQRLGMKPPPQRDAPRERRVRQEKELYVPAFRRREQEDERERERERDRDRERDKDRERDRDRAERERDRDRRVRDRERQRRASPQQPTSSSHAESNNKKQRQRSSSAEEAVPPQRQRIGSRVIVAPSKPAEPSDEEDEKHVNSVIKIKPRPPMSPSKQACKNLLLRAVAEATTSTILAKSRRPKEPAAVARPKISARLGDVVSSGSGERGTNLFTKSYRDRLKRSAATSSTAGAGTLFRRTTQHLVIEVEGDLKRATLCKRRRRNSHDDEEPEEAEEEAIEEEEEYAAGGDSDVEYVYVPQTVQSESADEQSRDAADYDNGAEIDECDDQEEDIADQLAQTKTQFVVTLNDEKAPPKYKTRAASPLPQVSSSSSASRHNGVEASSTTHTNRTRSRGDSRSRNADIKSRLLVNKASSSVSPSTVVARISERDSSNSSPTSNTPPPPRRSELIEIYRKPKDIQKIIIKNDSEDDDMSPQKKSPPKSQRKSSKRHSSVAAETERSTTPPLPPAAIKPSLHEEIKTSVVASPTRSSPQKRKRTPIKFDLDQAPATIEREKDGPSASKRRSRERDSSLERRSGDERRKISIRTAEAKKYDNIPSLSSVALDSTALKVIKPKERCKYHPNCTKQFCEFYHPTAPCKSFPNCKFADKCMYSHPRCKYDVSCTNLDCNFSHSGPRNMSLLQPIAPPISSHVVPVQNYKSISAAPAASSSMCKYYPNCTKVGCTFYHPKPCRFGKNCINKLECNFYHHEVQSSSKFKWVASVI